MGFFLFISSSKASEYRYYCAAGAYNTLLEYEDYTSLSDELVDQIKQRLIESNNYMELHFALNSDEIKILKTVGKKDIFQLHVSSHNLDLGTSTDYYTFNSTRSAISFKVSRCEDTRRAVLYTGSLNLQDSLRYGFEFTHVCVCKIDI
jgi:hypothetical protein